jgi:hypothetical protein
MLTIKRVLFGLTFKQILLVFFLIAFAEQEASVLMWLASLGLSWGYSLGTEPALQGLCFSAIGVAANAGLIWGALRLLAKLIGNERDGRPVRRAEAAVVSGETPIDLGPLPDQGGRERSEPAAEPEKGVPDEQRHQCN